MYVYIIVYITQYEMKSKMFLIVLFKNYSTSLMQISRLTKADTHKKIYNLVRIGRISFIKNSLQYIDINYTRNHYAGNSL